MSFTSTVENGAIKLPAGVHLPDGTKVVIEAEGVKVGEVVARKPFAERYAKYIGLDKDGPEDLSANH